MRAVDTNLVVRLFAQDDAGQAAAARQAMVADSVFVPKTVVVEFEWVMRGVYGATRAMIASAIETILATANVEVEDSTAIAQAVNWFKAGMDFADAVHLTSSSHAELFLTFDASLRRRASTLGAKPVAVAP